MTSPASDRQPAGTVRTLKRDGRRGVFLVADGGAERVVKRWPLTPWELVKLALGIAQAQRQLRGARRLRAAGVPTPEPLGGVRFVWERGPFVEIRLPWVEGESLLARLRSGDAAMHELLGEQMGGLFGKLAAARLFHRDAKLTNFVVDRADRIVAIDPVGVRRSRDPASERERLRSSLRCELSPDEAARADGFLRRAFGEQ